MKNYCQIVPFAIHPVGTVGLIVSPAWAVIALVLIVAPVLVEQALQNGRKEGALCCQSCSSALYAWGRS